MATSSSTLPSPPPPFQVLSVIPTASYLALTSGPHVHLHSLSPPAFAPLASTSTLPAADQHSWLVRTTAVSADGRWIATGCDGKELRVWEVAEDASAIKLSSVRKVLKKVAAFSFNSKNDIVFGDKLGDAYTYPLHPHPASSDLLSKRTTFEVTADPSLNPDGTLLLGHTSPLTSLALAPGEGFVVTSDRDEHVRISRYPEGSIVERFLVGHTKFISTVLVLQSEGNEGRLVSAGGDRELYVWDVCRGECETKVPVAEAVVPLIAVRGQKRLRATMPAAAPAGVETDAAAAPKPDDEVEETIDLEADSRVAAPAPTGGTVDIAREEDLGLAVMGLAELPGRVAFFSLGATAVFTASLPLDGSSVVEAVDVGHPVLAFAPLPPALSGSEGETLLLVSFDATRSSSPAAVGLALISLPAAGSGQPGALLPASHPLLSALLDSSSLGLSSSPPAAPLPETASKKQRAAPPSPLLASQWALYQALTDLPKHPTETPLVAEGGRQAEVELAASRKELERRKRNGGVATKQAQFPGKRQKKGPKPGESSSATPGPVEDAVLEAAPEA